MDSLICVKLGSLGCDRCGLCLGAYDGKPDCTFSFKDSDFVAVALGKLNPQMAFLRSAFFFFFSILFDCILS